MYFHCDASQLRQTDGVHETDIGANATRTKDGIKHKEEACANIEATRRHQSSHHIIPWCIDSLPNERIGTESIIGEALHWVL